MREIKFRGRTEDGRWAFGNFVISNGFCFITTLNLSILTYATHHTEVIPETIGQFTGLKDKNGKEIYEGDTLAPYGAEIVWNERLACWCGRHKNDVDMWPIYESIEYGLEIIGNIHENEGLLK